MRQPRRRRRAGRRRCACSLGPTTPATALFTGNNRNTVGALRALADAPRPRRAGRLRRLRARRPARHHRRPRRPRRLGGQARRARVRPPGRRRAPTAHRTVPTGSSPAVPERCAAVKPLRLPPNQPHRFYRGGARIAALRGAPAGEDGRPEDWVGSTATRAARTDVGLTGSRTARAARRDRADPEAWLGADHVARLGADPALLVKLLDAGERLPVHCHPGRAFAARAPRPALRQDGGVADPRGRARTPRSTSASRERVEAETVRGWVEAPGRRGDARRAAPRCRSRPATRSSCRPARRTRSAAGSCCSSCRSRRTSRCSSSGSASASTTAPSTSGSAGRRRCGARPRPSDPAALSAPRRREPAPARGRPLLPRRAGARRRRARAVVRRAGRHCGAGVLRRARRRLPVSRGTTVSSVRGRRDHGRPATSRRCAACRPPRRPERGTGDRTSRCWRRARSSSRSGACRR